MPKNKTKHGDMSFHTADEILQAWHSGEKQCSIARRLGISQSSVSRAVRGISWFQPGRQYKTVLRRARTSPEDIALAAQLFQAGLSIPTVAEKLEIPRRAAQRVHAKVRRNLTMEPGHAR
jgi:DNA-binding transcriptional regulator LsrR (DeoR family)